MLLSEVLNYDFAAKGMDEPITDAELAGMSGLQALRDRVVAQSGSKNPTPRDFVRYSGRGTLREMPRFVGTPREVADGLEEWFTGGRVRRLRARRHAHARRLRGLRAPGRAGAAAPRAVPSRVLGPDAAREPRAAARPDRGAWRV